MALGAKAENILAVSQWIEDNQKWLFEVSFRDEQGRERLPSQATMYQLFWVLEQGYRKVRNGF